LQELTNTVYQNKIITGNFVTISRNFINVALYTQMTGICISSWNNRFNDKQCRNYV